MDRHVSSTFAAPAEIPWRLIAWVSTLAGIPLAVGIALGLLINVHAAFTAVGVYFAALLMWAALRAMGGRRESTRSAQLVLAIGVVTGIVAQNMAIALTLCVFGAAGLALAIAAGAPDDSGARESDTRWPTQ